jgi:hypothetical protein
LITIKCKILLLKKFPIFKKRAIFVISRPPGRTSKPHEKLSVLKKQHAARQKIKFINFFCFCGPFCPPGSGSEYS